MDTPTGQDQRAILRLTSEELETVVAALGFALLDGFKILEANWDNDAYRTLMIPTEGIIAMVNVTASRVEETRVLIAKLTANSGDQTTDLDLSEVVLERLGYALYSYGYSGYQRALNAALTKVHYMNNTSRQDAVNHLNLLNERAFALFKRLEQHKGNVEWMVWRRAR